MTDNLVGKLKEIDIQASEEWKTTARSFLLSQIKNETKIQENFIDRIYQGWRNFAILDRFAWKPVSIFVLIALVVLGGSSLAVAVAQKSNPGDSMFLVKRGIEEIRLAVERDNSRKVALAGSILASRMSELNLAVETELIAEDSFKKDTISLAVSEVKKQVQVVNSNFNILKNNNQENNQEMAVAAMGLNKKMIGYKQELKDVKEKVNEEVEIEINKVLNEVDDVNADVLSVIVAQRAIGDTTIADNEIADSLEEHIYGIQNKAEEVLAVLSQEDDQSDLVKKVVKVKEEIAQAGEALREGQYSLVLTLANNSNKILKILYGQVDEIIQSPDELNTAQLGEETDEENTNPTSTVESVSDGDIEILESEESDGYRQDEPIEKIDAEVEVNVSEDEFEIGIQ